MATLIFDASELKPIVEHTILHFANQSNIAYTKKKPAYPALILVHDQGVYLMSNAKERQLKDAKEPEGSALVAYAKGCHPDKDDDWWDNARELVGGDDFGETIEWAIQIKAKIDAGEKKIKITLTANRMGLL